ncbi:hypothetical protein HK105_202478 [Polyrhizophydium stewartii]|uniref:MoaB/Mog domain-containing protein n=1 Tax=Polyrhizophydium stewartii TaxID=2732419 RepID=A0ABR4NF27_9FUNG
MRVAVITVSDRASAGSADDRSGPALAEFARSQGWAVAGAMVVPDAADDIQHAVRAFTDAAPRPLADVVLTTGGTGFGVRDVTPEAVRPLLDKEAAGLAAAMLVAGLAATPMAALSRPVCGVRGRSLVLTLPGSVRGALENLAAVARVLPHAAELASGVAGAGEALHAQMHGGHPGHSRGHSHGHHHHHDRHDHHHGHAAPLSGDPAASVARRPRASPFPLVEFDAALATVLRHAPALGHETRPVGAALVGRVLAQDVVARENVPAFRASIVDGYAVVASDGPGAFPVAAVATAGGKEPAARLEPGTVARIATGAPVPDGADAVVMVEATSLVSTTPDGAEEATIEIHEAVRPGQDIREIGSDVRAGERVLAAGTAITPVGGELGVIASVGITAVRVFRKPVVALLSTGNEVVDAAAPGPIPVGAVRDTNRPSLAAVLAQLGFDVLDLGIAPDDHDALVKVMSEALATADVVITTGGVSMGERDLLKAVLERALAATIHFGRVRLKPGKPTTFATARNPLDASDTADKLIFALPGNPVSTMVTFYLFVLPALRSMSGFTEPNLARVQAKLTHAITLDPRPEFFRARITFDAAAGGFTATGTGMQRSSRMQSMAMANAMLALPTSSPERKQVLAGDTVDAVVIGGL